MDKKKREPLLADKWLAEGECFGGTEQFVKSTKDDLRLAKRFVLDTDATRYCAEIIREAPRIVADAQDFAIPPFHRTYIEIPFRTWFQAMTGRESDEDGDIRIGYLFVGNTLRVLAEAHTRKYKKKGDLQMDVGLDKGKNEHSTMLYPLQYNLWSPFKKSAEAEFLKTVRSHRFAIDVFYWGESALRFLPGRMVDNHTFDIAVPPPVTPENEWTDAVKKLAEETGCSLEDAAYTLAIREHVTADHPHYDKLGSAWDLGGLRALRENHSFEFILKDKWKQGQAWLWEVITAGSCGELRNAMALLLFLNRTQKIRVERDEPMLVNRMYKRRPIPLLRHRVITLKVDPKPRLLRLCAGEGIRRRLHDVRGCFCHDRIARESHHLHEWIEVETTADMAWYCECGAKRWWRREHQRGHQREGVVQAEYRVTK